MRDGTATERRIVETLHSKGPLTGRAIAEESGIPAPTVHEAVRRLVKQKVVKRTSPRGPIRLVETQQPERRGKPKGRRATSSGGRLNAAVDMARTDPEGTKNVVDVFNHFSLSTIATLAEVLGKPLVALVAARQAQSLRGGAQSQPRPTPQPGPPPGGPQNGHSDPPAAPGVSLRVVKPPAHRDPQHVCPWPEDKPGLQVGHAWVCGQDRAPGCGRQWTWTGEGWTPWHHPAGFKARETLRHSWQTASRDLHIETGGRASVLRGTAEVQSDLQQRIAAYAAAHGDPTALRQLSQLAIFNPRRADAILRRAGH